MDNTSNAINCLEKKNLALLYVCTLTSLKYAIHWVLLEKNTKSRQFTGYRWTYQQGHLCQLFSWRLLARTMMWSYLYLTDSLPPYWETFQSWKMKVYMLRQNVTMWKEPFFVFVLIIWQHMDWLAFKRVFLLLNCSFFGLLYALNFHLPKELKYTCEVIQKVFLALGDDCSSKVQSFKNKLLG